jgi:hypothetical protein
MSNELIINELNKKQEEKNNQIKKPEGIGVIGIPHTGTFPWQTTMSLLTLKLPQNFIVKYHLIGSCLVYDAREKIIQFCENENADWLLFLDSDMVIPADALLKFVNCKLDGNKLDVVGGICFKRIPPFQPCFYTKARINPETKKPLLESPIDFPDTGLLEVEGIGMACTFIRKNAWQAMKKKHEQLFFPYFGIGEDLSFCIRARMTGIKMFADLSVNVGHIGHVQFDKQHFFMARDEHRKNKPDEPLFREV